MSRYRYQAVMTVAVAVLIALAGCAGKEEPDPRAVPGGEDFSPERIVERVMTALQMGDTAGMPAYFARDVDPKLVNDFIKNVNSEISVDRYKALPESSSDNKADVKVYYQYQAKQDGVVPRGAKKQVAEKQFELVKEDDVWRVRRTGFEDFDRKVEERLFMQCLNSVMDATIAEEITRRLRGEYAGSIAALLKVMPELEEEACDELNIEKAGESSYLITAKTLNYDPCMIAANTDSYAPRSYRECPSFEMDSIPQLEETQKQTETEQAPETGAEEG